MVLSLLSKHILRKLQALTPKPQIKYYQLLGKTTRKQNEGIFVGTFHSALMGNFTTHSCCLPTCRTFAGIRLHHHAVDLGIVGYAPPTLKVVWLSLTTSVQYC